LRAQLLPRRRPPRRAARAASCCCTGEAFARLGAALQRALAASSPPRRTEARGAACSCTAPGAPFSPSDAAPSRPHPLAPCARAAAAWTRAASCCGCSSRALTVRQLCSRRQPARRRCRPSELTARPLSPLHTSCPPHHPRALPQSSLTRPTWGSRARTLTRRAPRR
jgi:hypothetical protein